MTAKDAIKVQTITGYDEDLVADLVALQQKAFPAHMQFPEPSRYYEEGLRDRDAINIVIKGQKGRLIGHLQAFPQSSVYAELRQWDPAMQDAPERIYLDIIQVLPEQRGKNHALRLFQTVCAEAERRGIYKLSMHVRTVTGFHGYLRRIFADIRTLRRIENWYGSGEPFDYMEAATILKGQRRKSSRF